MDAELAALVERRIDADPDVDTAAGLLVLAACGGEERLAAELAGAEPDEDASPREAASAGTAGAWLTSIAVEGFRGIGPRAELTLQPGPGLTLVVGANGCGKSSFAEGLEILLTGDNTRWKARSAIWREGWRNLHHEGAVRVEAGLAIEGVERETVAERRWEGGDLAGSAAAVQTAGQPRGDLSSLGWDEALTGFRPFLSYHEIGAMLEAGPAALYDSVSRVLGLDDLVDARERLRQARLDRERATREATEGRDGLLVGLEALDDDRARQCLEALSGKAWDLDLVERTLGETGESAADGELTLLRQLAALDAPGEAEARGALDGLRAAQEAADALRDTDADRALRVADLLAAAAAFHEHAGDQPCPVCEAGTLDAAWRERAGREEARLRGEAGEADAARRALDAAARSLRDLVRPAPPALGDASRAGVDASAARAAWEAWAAVPEDADAPGLAAHAEAALPPLREALAGLRDRAGAELARREDAWRPLAQRLLAWLPGAREAQRGQERVAGLRAAERWLQAAAADFRDERFAPIADRSSEIWQRLRQGSSIDITGFGLAGSGNQRRLAVDVTIDGAEGAALGVMSQGELHSLALSLFLPRATLEASPFRFVVIDDPVQAMDPSKVDGLARVLDRIARERQVIVFTHDDRLAEAVRRLGVGARQLEVARRDRSVVEVREVADPIARYIEDARALTRTPELPPETARRVVPGFCRNALEAACMEAVRRRRIGRGEPHAEVERALEAASTLTAKAALALFDDAERAGEVGGAINSRYGRPAGDAFAQSNRGAHGDVPAQALLGLVEGAERLARQLRALR